MLMGVFSHSPAILANDYDFAFNVHKTPSTRIDKKIKSDLSPSDMSWRVGVQGLLVPNFLKGSGELVYGRFTENSNTNFSDWNRYLLKIGMSGKQQQFGYGLNFYSVGQQFEGDLNSIDRQRKGHTGYESWVSFDFNKLQIKTSFLEFWTKKQLHEQMYELGANYPIFLKPNIRASLSYGVGTREYNQSLERVDSIDLLKAKIYFKDDYLKLSTGLDQFSLQGKLNHRGYKKNIIYISSTFFPKNPLSVVSSYRYSMKNYLVSAYGSNFNKMESSLGLVYRFKGRPSQFRLSSGYKRYQSNDGRTAGEIVKFSAKLNWKARKFISGLKTNWTMDFRYKDRNNFSSPALSSDDWSFKLSCNWLFS